MFQEIEVPHGAAKLAVRCTAQPDLRLSADDAFDGRVFGGAQAVGGNLSALAARAPLSARRGEADCQRDRREKEECSTP
jgi:hypothetical protein